MSVRVEFYGIARQRAGIDSIDIEANTLGEAIDRIRAHLPQLAETCFEDRGLRAGFLANVDGRKFTTNAEEPLASGQSLLILPADAGG